MCSLVGSSCAEGSRRTTSTTTPKCGPTIEEQGQLAGGCARSGRSGDGWVENTLLSMQTRARAHALSTSYELLFISRTPRRPPRRVSVNNPTFENKKERKASFQNEIIPSRAPSWQSWKRHHLSTANYITPPIPTRCRPA